MSNYDNTNFYRSNLLSSVERVRLVEDLPLPEITKEPLNREYMRTGKEYILATNVYKDTVAQFYLPVMTPLLNNNEKSCQVVGAPSRLGQYGSKLNTSSYTTCNYISLVIPKYILLEFVDFVPAGTEFLVAGVGGSTDVDDMRIIGLYSKFL